MASALGALMAALKVERLPGSGGSPAMVLLVPLFPKVGVTSLRVVF